MDLRGKRVLLTTSHRGIGSGGSMQLFLLARGLVEAGARVRALFHEGKESPRERHLEMLEKLPVTLGFFRPSRWYNPLEIARMRRFLVNGRFDIIHTHKGGDLSLVLLASAGISLPVLVTTRGVSFPLGANRFKYRLSKLDRIIVVSEDSKKIMVDCGVDDGKIRVIYGGVDTTRFSPRPKLRDSTRRDLGIPQDAIVSLMAANLVRQKGHRDYLHAAGLLKEAHPRLVHLFAGRGDSAALEKETGRLGLGRVVRFLGFRKDMEALYAASDFSVVASFAGEGVSGVLRESMACRIPVITTDVGGNPELVRDGETGIVVPMKDSPALAAAMDRLIRDRELYERVRDRGWERVVKKFSAKARAEKIFRLYEEVLAEKR